MVPERVVAIDGWMDVSGGWVKDWTESEEGKAVEQREKEKWCTTYVGLSSLTNTITPCKEEKFMLKKADSWK